MKNKLFFRETEENPITDYAILIKEIEYMSSKPRYVFVTDFETVLAQDTKTKESLDISFEDLPQYFDFFLAWNGVEKADLEKENPLDVKAAERFARLYELLNEINKDEDKHHLSAGEFFILKGVMVYVAEKGEEFEKNGRTNSRLQLIYENGTTSDNLLRSFSRELYRDGKRVTESEDLLLENDVSSGYIYVARSLSENPQIKNIDNLYKIGATTGSVERRVSNAQNESTFLYASVEIITKYHVYNINPHHFENAIQKVFSDKNLDVEIVANNGRLIVPREWFIVDLEEIDETINKIITTINYL